MRLPSTGDCAKKGMTSSRSAKPRNHWKSFQSLTFSDLLDSISIGRPQSGTDVEETAVASGRVPQAVDSIDFSGCTETRWTWLGHASVLMQVPPAHGRAEPFSVLFDPIASKR